MPISNQNTVQTEKFAIHKNSDSIGGQFSYNYEDYLLKKEPPKKLSFFTTSKKIDTTNPTAIEKKSIDWLTVLIFLAASIFILVRYFYYRRFNLFIRAFGSVRLLNQFLREGNLFNERFSIPLFLAYIFSFSLFCYQIIMHYDLNIPFEVGNRKLLLIIAGSIFSIYILKLFIRLFLGVIFKTREETYEHLINIYIFDTIAALLIFPILIIQTYNSRQFLFLIGAAIILIVFFYRLIRLTILGMNKSKFSGYYLFLYLCSVEILPVLVFGKLAIIYLG